MHFAEVFRYTPFPEDPGFQVHEVVTGPPNAGLFRNRLYDATLNAESLFFCGPDAPVTSWAQAKPWMNFGLAQADEHGHLTLSVNKIDGAPVYSLTLDPR